LRGIHDRPDSNLDLFWLRGTRDQSGDQAETSVEEIVDGIVADLQFALAEMSKLKPAGAAG
jgi:hypothetical protein